ncbi:glycosyltransferase family 2 protein [Rhizobium mesoamericanum]|uniref:glycosyltransferase family 2 protein n=1 Tax=Rhizobium mesoamericanum TaxID=1079800 RepID=UPI00048AABE2|nr:glycosyltransferase family 2 protein [Rhizobium mesoamericanum]
MTASVLNDHDKSSQTHESDWIEQKPLAVITVTYNSADVLPNLLSSLEEGLVGVSRFEVIVVDNNSRDDSVAIAKAHPIGARVIPTGRNGGYSAGINAGAAIVPTDWNILILNPDLQLIPGAAVTMSNRLRDPKVGVVVPQILNPDGSLSLSLRREPSLMTAWSEALLGGLISSRLGTGEIIGDLKRYESPTQVDWATGAILMVSAHARQVVGDWDERFFLYSEEVDYMRRVRMQGLAVAYEPQAKAMHIGGDTKASPFLFAVQTTSRLRDFNARSGPVRRMLFRAGVATGEAIRSFRDQSHRAALKAALSPVRPIVVA